MAKQKLPITHWSHSSLMAYLRNPLAWYKRYVEKIYDTPSTPASVVGRAGHKALEHFYGGLPKEAAIQLGLEYLKNVPDFEINFGVVHTRAAKKKRRTRMECEYLQAVLFYLEKPPRYDVLGVEVKSVARVEGVALPIKAVSDLVVRSKTDPRAVDIVDHKFVDSFSRQGKGKTLFIIQAIFNYYVVRDMYGKPVRRFIIHECKKSRNADGSAQMKRYVIDYAACGEEFALFRRLINDATRELAKRRIFLPNPSDMFEGEDSFMVYRLGLTSEE